jgi:hypothetical protein
LPVSRFNPALVEASRCFVVAGPHLGSFRLCPTEGQPIGRRGLLVLAPFGAFARKAKVDDVIHQEARGIRVI